jgi:hypothetical protein
MIFGNNRDRTCQTGTLRYAYVGKGSLALSDHAAVVVDIRQGKSKLDHKLES